MATVSGRCPSYGSMRGPHLPGAQPRRNKYIRDIPLKERYQICRMLDASNSWVILAANLNFSNDDVQTFRRALFRDGGSPTDEMLTKWDHGNHTVTELYKKLYDMKHARGMDVLKDLVDPSLHRLILDVQGIQPTEEGSGSSETVLPGHSQMPPVTYIPGAWGEPPNAQGSHPSVPQGATQGSWHGGDSLAKPQQSSNSNSANNQKQQQYQRPGRAGDSGEGLTVNMDAGSSEKVVGLGSPFKGWPGEKSEGALSVSSSGSYQRNSGSLNKAELASGNSSGGPGMLAQAQELGEKEKLENFQNQYALCLLMHFNYDDIVQATKNFNSAYKLGEGSFGTVYHAIIKRTNYAVKRLKQNEHMGFENNKIARADQMKELRALVTYRNPYIVALCAYCFDGPSPCLVYEFMENGSLEDNLLCKAQKAPLEWRTRHRIAEGAAEGINFLHTAQDQPLIHGDIKSANILLGRHMEPKIADFGLARFGPEDGKSYCYLKTKNAHGTLPYLPEEFKRNFKLSTKVDVYSFGVVLLEILAGERVADSRREPNRLLTDMVEEALELEEPEAVIDKIRDRRCPDWPWDIAAHLLDLARKCTTAKFTHRPEIDEAVNTLTNIAAEIARRDEMQKQREELSMQNSKRRSAEFYLDPYSTQQQYNSHEMGIQYPPTAGGRDRVSMQRDWSVDSSSLGTGIDPRSQGNPPPRRPQSYDLPSGQYQYGGPRPGFEPGYRRYTLSETSDENNLAVDEKLIDSLSSMTSYDMSSHLNDPSACVPLLYPSQSSVPSSVGYAKQQSAPYSGQMYDPRQAPYRGQQGGHQPQTAQQGYPPQPAQYRNLVAAGGGGVGFGQHHYPEPRQQAPAASYQQRQTSTPKPNNTIHADKSLQDHLKRLDISQLPTKPVGRPTPNATETGPSQLEPPTVRRQPEQNTDILPGCRGVLKGKSAGAPAAPVSSIREAGEEQEEAGGDDDPLQTSLTTTKMRQFLDSRAGEPSQQTERIQGTSCLTGRPSASTSELEETAQSSLTTVQMREFLSGRREPTETTEESNTEKLDRALSLAAMAHQKKMFGQPDTTPVTASEQPATNTTSAATTNADETDQAQVSLTTTQMRQFMSGQRRGPTEDSCGESGALAQPASPARVPATSARIPTPGNTAPLRSKQEDEAGVCCSAPANMAAPLTTNRAPQPAGDTKTGGMTEPVKDTQ